MLETEYAFQILAKNNISNSLYHQYREFYFDRFSEMKNCETYEQAREQLHFLETLVLLVYSVFTEIIFHRERVHSNDSHNKTFDKKALKAQI